MCGHEFVRPPAGAGEDHDARTVRGQFAGQVLAHRREAHHTDLMLRHSHTLTKASAAVARSTGEMATPVHTARHAPAAVRRAAANPVVEFLERVGYVARGILYLVMGSLALGLALGVGGKATDQSGSLTTLGGGTFGKILLLTLVVGLAAYSFWGFVRAIFDPLHRGDHPAGIAERVGSAWSGSAYGGLAIFALELFAGTGKATFQDSTQSAISKFFTYPAGHWLVIAIGLISIAVGLGQFFLSKNATFKKDLKREEMSPAEKKYVDFLGRFGYFARGVTFTLVGWFVLQAGLHRDPSQAKGFSGAFVFLLNQPYGHLLLAVVALGFVALGLHSFACARWMRLLGSSS